nr:ABC transporter ATP-binding protein [uncultured Desulfuromonas sp.]
MSCALNIHHLHKSFGRQCAVEDLSLTINRGEIFGLLGPNGAGKSTTINMICGVSRIDSGSVSVFGYDTRHQSQHARRLTGVMHQEVVTDAFFTIDKALKMHPGFFGVKSDPAWRELLIDRLDLSDHLHKRMNCLSGGMKRRFMLAKALIHKPRLLILDEPTAGVDIELRHTIWSFIREINQHDTTILLTTHYLEEAEHMCDRIGIMNSGQLIALDSTRALLNHLDTRQATLELNQPLESIPQWLGLRQFHLSDDRIHLSVNLSADETVCDLMQLCHQHGLSVHDLNTVSPNLEEVFLHLTRSCQSQGATS